MIIHVERSGGFTGMSQRALIDTDQLDPQERQELEQLVDTSGFFNTALGPAPSTSKPDRFHYKITIEHSPQSRTIELGENEIPSGWQPLIQRIDDLSRRFRT